MAEEMAKIMEKIMEILEKLKEFNISVNASNEAGKIFIEMKIPRSRINFIGFFASTDGLIMPIIVIRGNGHSGIVGFGAGKNKMRISIEKVKGNWKCIIDKSCVSENIADFSVAISNLAVKITMDKKHLHVMMWVTP